MTHSPGNESRPSFEDALRFHAVGRRREAVEICHVVLRRDPGHVGALRLSANVAYAEGRRAEAAELLVRATRAAPRNATVHDELGLVQLGCKRPDEALRALRCALTLDPTLVRAQNNLGIALRDTGRAEEAESAFRKALELDPRFAGAYDNLADSLRRRGNIQDARACLEKALQVAPHSTTTRVSLGDLLVEHGELETAVSHYRQALAQDINPPPIRVRLGIALREMNDRAGSLAALQQAVTEAPTAPQPRYQLAYAQLAFGQIHEAIDTVQAALKLQSDFSEAHELHAAALVAGGDIDGGLAQLRRAFGAAATPGAALATLAARLLETGHSERALECLRLKVQCDPLDATARHYVAALSGVNPDRASDDYVRTVFDGCADSFDRTLQGQLGYSVPRELVRALIAVSTRDAPWDALDLGCGTGLVGAELAPRLRSLTGIDLSTRMLERARERGTYTSLRCADIASALYDEPPADYDIVTAGDVFIYVGKLDAVIPAVRRTLRSRGMFAFSAEAAEYAPAVSGEVPPHGYRLCATGRYVHSGDYLRELAALNDFRIERQSPMRLRFESRRPVMGWLNLWVAS